MKLEKNKSLKEMTTWRVGGPADFFVEARSVEEAKEAIAFANKEKIPFVIIGNGSNILVNDNGFRGLVIKINDKKINIKGKNIIECSSGLSLAQLMKLANDNNLYGAEFLWGIPGTVGGAIVGNAGMNNMEIKNILASIKYIDSTGKIVLLKKDDIKFTYRSSSLKSKNIVIISAKFKLSKKKNNFSINLPRKRENQPIGFSAGSVFKNPRKGWAAGKMIEDLNLRGKKIGGAKISEMHGNFILNINNAKSSDILKLITEIQDKVKNKFGVQLKTEVRLLGEKGWE